MTCGTIDELAPFIACCKSIICWDCAHTKNQRCPNKSCNTYDKPTYFKCNPGTLWDLKQRRNSGDHIRKYMVLCHHAKVYNPPVIPWYIPPGAPTPAPIINWKVMTFPINEDTDPWPEYNNGRPSKKVEKS